jgi:hypothetical protein
VLWRFGEDRNGTSLHAWVRRGGKYKCASLALLFFFLSLLYNACKVLNIYQKMIHQIPMAFAAPLLSLFSFLETQFHSPDGVVLASFSSRTAKQKILPKYCLYIFKH